jgi:hypothetical protein
MSIISILKMLFTDMRVFSSFMDNGLFAVIRE